MAEERPIRFHLLNKDELIYEIAIRDGVPENTVERLRAQIKKLALQIPSDEVNIFEGDVNSELQTIKTKLTELEEICDQKPLLLKRLHRIQSLGNHLFHRLSRVEPVEQEDRTLKEQLDGRLLVLLKRMDRMLHTFSSSFDFKPQVDVGVRSGVAKEEFEDACAGQVTRKVVMCDRTSSVPSLNLKFNGRDNVVVFIQRLEELCLSRNISTAKLFNSAVELFSDDALCWYRAVRDEVNEWEQLKALLLEEYLPPDYDYRLLKEIRSRTQGADESISHYLSVMQNYFSRLNKPLDSGEKLEIAKFNIRPFYSTQLAMVEVDSWSNLKKRCRQLEAAKQRADLFCEPPQNVPNAVAPDLAYQGNHRTSRSKCAVQSQNPAKHCLDLEMLIKTDKEKKAILDKLNDRRNKVAAGELRSFPAAESMLKLEWNTKLELIAQRWANQCVKNSVPDIKDACRDLDDTIMGQNIATIYGESPGLKPTALVDVWYMELLNVNGSILPLYTESSEDGPHYDYFTQLVWSDTSEVGCGGVKFKELLLDKDGNRNRTVYRLVCNFAPSGNRKNQSVYSLGTPCSKCPEGAVCDASFNALCTKPTKRNVFEEISNKTKMLSSQSYINTEISTINDTTKSDETESTNILETDSNDENYTPFDYFSHLHEFTKQTVTVTSKAKSACKDVLAVEDFIDLLRKRLSNDHVFKELLLATKTTQGFPDTNFTDASVAAFVNRIYSKKLPLTTFKSTENELLNSTLLVDLVEAVIFRSGDKTPANVVMTLSTLPMSDVVSPIKIQAELGQLQQNDDFTGHYFFPEDDEESSSTTESSESYYDAPNLSISDVIMEIEDIRKSTVTRNFLDDILELESSIETTTAIVLLSPDDMNAHKSGHEVMKKFLEDIKDKTGGE